MMTDQFDNDLLHLDRLIAQAERKKQLWVERIDALERARTALVDKAIDAVAAADAETKRKEKAS